MKFQDEAIIISVRKFSENKLLLKVLTKNYLLKMGIVSIPYSKNLQLYQPGNVVFVDANAKDVESLCKFHLEPLGNTIARVINRPKIVVLINSVTSLIAEVFALESIESNKLFYQLYNFLNSIDNEENMLAQYVYLEMEILAMAGFGMDLQKCAVTSSTDNLLYISPKSGKAVSKNAAEGFENRLFKMTKFFSNKIVEIEDIVESLEITGYFIEKFIYCPRKIAMPEVRKLMINMLSRKNKELMQ